MILSPAFKIFFPEGCRGKQIINGIPTTLLTPWRPQCPRFRPPRRPSGGPKCYGGSYYTKNRSPWVCRGARIINRIRHNNFKSLKATMVNRFADMPREGTTLLLMNGSPCNPIDYHLFESLRESHQQEPPKHFGIPKGIHGGLIPEHAQEGKYAAWSHYRSRIQHVTKAKGGFI